jgi:CBS-domain-containing membrane protein
MKTVKDILAAKGGDVWWVRSNASVLEAMDLMKEKDIGALLVKDAQRNIVGIFSERDYARKVVHDGRPAKELRVEEVMTPAARMIVAKPDTRVDECMAIMTEKHIRHLPVVGGHSIVGVVSSRDLIKAYLEESAHHIDNLNDISQTFFSQSFDDDIAGHKG